MGLAKLISTIFTNGGGKTHLGIANMTENALHSKQLWEMSHIFESIANNGEAFVYVSSPPAWLNTEFHYSISANVGGNCYVRFYRNPIISLPGTDMPSSNRYQDEVPDELAVTGVYHTPTITQTGHLLSESFAPGGSGVAVVGGEGDAKQWITTGHHSFLARITNVSGGTIHMSVSLVGHT